MALHVVVGPPCAGKSTFIRANKTSGDVVVDFDALARALGSAAHHNATGNVKTVAKAARVAAIECAVQHGYDAWVIHTTPTSGQLAWYTAHGATFHYIDPGRAECLARADRDERPTWTRAAISRWYRVHKPELEHLAFSGEGAKASRSW